MYIFHGRQRWAQDARDADTEEYCDADVNPGVQDDDACGQQQQ
jgi:hypothetical protein